MALVRLLFHHDAGAGPSDPLDALVGLVGVRRQSLFHLGQADTPI